MRPTECTATTIELAEQCAQGVHINWSQFLLNEPMDDAVDMQELPIVKFHFSWILILISFATWTPPPDYQPMDVPVELLGASFQNLWDHKDNKRKADTKLAFFLQGERLKQIVRKQYRPKLVTVAKYPFIHFHAGLHNIIMHLRNDPKKHSLSTFFILRDADIEREIKEWPK